MNDNLLTMISAATAAPQTGIFRGLEEAHAVCHITSHATLDKADKAWEKSREGAGPPATGGQPRLSVSVSESDSAMCQLCKLGHKTQHGKDLGKVLTFSTAGATGMACVTSLGAATTGDAVGDPASALTTDSEIMELHHLCGTLALRGDKTAFTIEELQDALDEAKTRRCHACNAAGAFIQCCYGDCSRWYHLGCSMNATDVVIDASVGQLYCPKHTVPDSDDSLGADVVFGAKPKKQRSKISSGYKAKASSKSSATKKKKQPFAVQRPRTDWQRRGANVWVKVVPPWWAEQRTVHFANKVFRELFANNLDVDLLDEEGSAWKCEVAKETRNDMRLQFTLVGQFQDLWAHAGIMPGDVLTFEKLVPGGDYDESTNAWLETTTAPHVIKFTKHAQGVGFEDLVTPKTNKLKVSLTSSGGGIRTTSLKPPRAGTAGLACGQLTRSTQSVYATHAIQAVQMSQGKIVIQETPWFFATDRIARKVMQPNNIAKARCPMPDELAKKIAGDLPAVIGSTATDVLQTVDGKGGDGQGGTEMAGTEQPAPIDHRTIDATPTTFAVYDQALRKHFVFDIDSPVRNGTRQITGPGFLEWMIEAAVKPKDSIQLEFAERSTGSHGGSVGASARVEAAVNHTVLVSKVPFADGTADAEGLSRVPSSDSSSNTTGMRTLAAAACYCHTHGTPGINALLLADVPSPSQTTI